MPAAAVLKVLVVDDQNSVRQMTRMTLEQIGVRHIHEAENGRVAMETASLQPLDLIISDFNMPEMDGLALLRAVRGHPAARKLPFILDVEKLSDLAVNSPPVAAAISANTASAAKYAVN